MATGCRQKLSAVRLRHRKAGFTLVELVLVMLLLAVVLAFAVPSLSRFTGQRVLEDETNRFLSLIRFARSEAASVGLPMMLWIDPQAQRYGIEPLTGYPPREDSLFDHELHRDITLKVDESPYSTGSQIQLVFLPDGTLGDQTPVTVVLEDQDEHRLYVSRSENGLTYEILRPDDYALRREQELRTQTSMRR
ncbi:MAG: GspH/FimT family protein [Verrucomicrobiales bacterium]|nr:GspH/FimT family protein [Verrucomicrobiales bacterium]